MQSKTPMFAKRMVMLLAGLLVLVMLIAVAIPDASVDANMAPDSGSPDNSETVALHRSDCESYKSPGGSVKDGDCRQLLPMLNAKAEGTTRSYPVDDRMAPAKPMSTLHFVRPVRYRANSGESLEVSLTLVAAEAVNDVIVEARADDGLIMTANARHSVGSLVAGREVTVTFVVTALAEGRHYVNVVAAARGMAGRSMSSHSIPVEVGDVGASGNQKSASRVVTDDQGNRLILMRAEDPSEGGQLRQ